jgi:hypothetical protein
VKKGHNSFFQKKKKMHDSAPKLETEKKKTLEQNQPLEERSHKEGTPKGATPFLR